MNNLSEKEKQVISYLYDEFKKGNKKFDLWCADEKVVSQRGTGFEDVKLFDTSFYEVDSNEVLVHVGDVVVKDGIPLLASMMEIEVEAYCDEYELEYSEHKDELMFVLNNWEQWNTIKKNDNITQLQKEFFEFEDQSLTKYLADRLCTEEEENKFIDKLFKSILQ